MLELAVEFSTEIDLDIDGPVPRQVGFDDFDFGLVELEAQLGRPDGSERCGSGRPKPRSFAATFRDLVEDGPINPHPGEILVEVEGCFRRTQQQVSIRLENAADPAEHVAPGLDVEVDENVAHHQEIHRSQRSLHSSARFWLEEAKHLPNFSS